MFDMYGDSSEKKLLEILAVVIIWGGSVFSVKTICGHWTADHTLIHDQKMWTQKSRQRKSIWMHLLFTLPRFPFSFLFFSATLRKQRQCQRYTDVTAISDFMIRVSPRESNPGPSFMDCPCNHLATWPSIPYL